jgi:sugar lactone lactonase YvrE
MNPVRGPQWVKLVGIDLATDKVVKTIHFPAGVVNAGSYFNDVRFDLRRGAEGLAFISDSAAKTDNAIVVVDLATGHSWRKLNGHPSVTGDHTFNAIMEGKPFVLNRPDAPPDPHHPGVDGIAMSADGERSFTARSRRAPSTASAWPRSPMSSCRIARSRRPSARRSATSPPTGCWATATGSSLTDWEHNAIVERDAPEQFRTLIHDERLWWPDTLALSHGGYLYVTANQLHRMPRYNDGKDLRQKPYYLFRVKVGGGPIELR